MKNLRPWQLILMLLVGSLSVIFLVSLFINWAIEDGDLRVIVSMVIGVPVGLIAVNIWMIYDMERNW